MRSGSIPKITGVALFYGTKSSARALLAALLFLFAALADAQSQYQAHSPWQKFHYSNDNRGASPNSGCTGVLKWKFLTQNAVESSPAIGADGTIYVSSDDGFLYALDPSTGQQKWSFGTAGTGGSTAMPDSPCIGADGTVYIGAGTGYLYALDGATGTQKWAFQTTGVVLGSPAIGPTGTIYCAAENTLTLFAINPDGSQLWSAVVGICGGSPAVGSDGTVYEVIREDPGGGLFAFDGATGAQKWSFTNVGAYFSSAAIGTDGTVYFGSDDDSFYAIDGSNGSEKWAFPTGGVVECSPVIDSLGNIYFGSADGNLYSINQSGNENWTFSTGAGNNYQGLTLAGDGTLYVGSSDFNVYALDSSTGTQKWHFGTYNVVDSSPSIGADGTVYVGSYDGNLYAFAAVALKNFYCLPNSVAGGLSTRAVVQITSSGPDGYTVSLGSSDPSVSVPSTVHVPANTTGVSFSLSTSGVSSNLPVTLTANLGTTSLQTTLTLTPAPLSNCYISPNAVIGGYSTRGVVQLAGQAGPGGTVVSLSDGSDISSAGSVTVPAGKSGVSFAINSSPVSASEQDTLTATLGAVTKQGTVTLNPAPVTNLYVSPSTITGGYSTYGVVQLAYKAGPSGDAVSIQSSSPDAVVPTTVTVPSGAKGASFLVTSSPVSASESITLTATFASASVQTSLTLNPAPLAEVYASPNPVTGSRSTTGVVQLAYYAGSSGNVVSLSSNNPSATVPATVTVPAGSKGVSFHITTILVSTPQTVTITATEGSSTQHGSLTVNPFSVSNFYASPNSIKGGASTRGVVQLAGPAGPGGNVISLSSPDVHVTVPTSVTVPTGSTGVSFAISTSPVISTEQITLTATFAGAASHTSLTLNP